MLSNRVLFGIVCLAAAGSFGLPDRSTIGDAGQERNGAAVERISADTGGKDREVKRNQQLAEVQAARVVRAARREIGVRESGENTGSRVDEYNAYVGLHKAAWCASFVSFCFAQAGFAEPRTAWSPALFPGERQIKGQIQYTPSRLGNSGFAETALGLSGGTDFATSRSTMDGLSGGTEFATSRSTMDGLSGGTEFATSRGTMDGLFGGTEFATSRSTMDGLSGGTQFATKRRTGAGLVLGIYYSSKGRIAHCGIVTHIDGDWCYSVEGNTNADGGREGNGVYAKRRHVRTIHRFADWISK